MQNRTSAPPPTESQAIMMMRIIWLALLMSQMVFFVLAYVIMPSPEVVNTNGAQIFFSVGVIALFLSYFIPRLLFKSLELPSDKITISTLYTPFIISLALNEVCAIMGFLVKRLTGENQISIALFIASILVYLSRFPIESKLKDQIEVLKNQTAQ